MNHIRIYPPGHEDGNSTMWLWEVRSDHDVVDCGTADCLEDAFDNADLCLADTL